ncbi:transglycosylase SLT domain-containing protein [Aquirufa sp. ROCK-SH2]
MKVSHSDAQNEKTYVPSFDSKIIDSLAQVEQGSPVVWSIDSWLVESRLKALEKQIPLNYNFHTHQFVEYFAFKKSDFTQRMLEKRDLYFPIYEKYLKLYNLPDELKYLSLIESGLDPKALSNKGAGGLWQFMPYTARGDFGLRVDPFIDERFDPERATEAACKYLRQLYKIFGDWHLALAAYNTGPGNVKRAIRNCRGNNSFWGIYNCLPKQTRAYVPQFIAMTYMMNFHWDHAIHAENWAKNIPSDTIKVNGYLNLATFTSLSKFSFDTLKRLNPHILSDFVPKDSKNFILRIPTKNYDYFSINRQSILDSSTKFFTSFNAKIDSLSNLKSLTLVKSRYKVRRGESIYDVARKFEISVFELKRINRLRSNRLKNGKLIWVLEKKWIENDAFTLSQKNTTSTFQTVSSSSKKRVKTKFYKVKNGDTLSEIAEKHDGLTITKLKKLNRLRSQQIKPGMRLRIS